MTLSKAARKRTRPLSVMTQTNFLHEETLSVPMPYALAGSLISAPFQSSSLEKQIARKVPPGRSGQGKRWAFAVSAVSLLLLTYSIPDYLLAFDWVPTDQEIEKYRKSWNPFSHGPILIQAVDIHPAGHFSIRPFIFSQIGEKRYGNRLTLATERKDGNVHLYSIQHPFINVAYGLTNHVELGLGTSVNTFWAKDSDSFNQGRGGPWTTNTGLGDTTLTVKYRPIIQDPDTRRPSITLISQLVLPTGVWFTGTERPPGGFAPLGRFPATQFGSLGLTEGITFRKISRPFRISGGVYYTYQLPGSDAGQTTYASDLVNTRLVFEHILDDKTGFGYNIELATLHGLTWRTDGHAINRGQTNGFSIIGVEPGIQWRFGQSSFVGAAGVLFTVAGQNAIDSIYPNFSIFWFWSEKGKNVIMR